MASLYKQTGAGIPGITLDAREHKYRKTRLYRLSAAVNRKLDRSRCITCMAIGTLGILIMLLLISKRGYVSTLLAFSIVRIVAHAYA